MGEIIKDLVKKGFGNNWDRPLECLVALREGCVVAANPCRALPVS